MDSVVPSLALKSDAIRHPSSPAELSAGFTELSGPLGSQVAVPSWAKEQCDRDELKKASSQIYFMVEI